MNKKSLFYKIGFNTIIQFGGKATSVLLGFITVALLTRYLGTAGYGNFTLVFAYMSFFGVFADFGLQLAIVRELSQKSISAEKIYGTYFWIKAILVILSTIVSIIALFFFPYSETLKIGILIGALAVGVGGLNGYGTAIFQSKIRLDLVTYIDILGRLVSVIFIAIFIYAKLNFYYIVSTILVGNLVGLLATIYLLKKDIKFNFKYDRNLAKKIIKWSLPIGLTSFFSLAYFKIDTIMLSMMKGSTDVGIYSLSYKILENILMLWGLYMASVYPALSAFLISRNKQNFNKIFKSTISIALTSSSFIIIIGFIFSTLIIKIFSGDEFNQSVLP
ncbi:MAG: oligosaccharide flippase family protein, partial [Actinobacteria bacterium]|nr:oligosaccharide flippase family protein [Actinomycetota bacterium]